MSFLVASGLAWLTSVVTACYRVLSLMPQVHFGFLQPEVFSDLGLGLVVLGAAFFAI